MFALRLPYGPNRPWFPPVSIGLAVKLAVKVIRELSLKYQEKMGSARNLLQNSRVLIGLCQGTPSPDTPWDLAHCDLKKWRFKKPKRC